MKHAEALIDRILYLDGVPNLQRLGPLHIGETVAEQFESTSQVEYAAVERLNDGIALCVAKGDNGTASCSPHPHRRGGPHRLAGDPAGDDPPDRPRALPGPAAPRLTRAGRSPRGPPRRCLRDRRRNRSAPGPVAPSPACHDDAREGEPNDLEGGTWRSASRSTARRTPRRRAAHAARALPPRAGRADRYEHRLRHVVVRRVHRPHRRRVGEELHVLAVQADGADITTIEGLATDGQLHPMQQAFMENHGLQCGYCTPGMVMAAIGLLDENPHPTEQEVRIGLEGNLCRCTGYHNIVKAVLAAAEAEGDGHDRHRDRPPRRRASGCCARRTRRCSPARPASPTTSSVPARCTWPWCAARTPTPASRRSTRPRRGSPASSPSTPAPTSPTPWAAPMPCAWPVTDDMKNPPHYPLAVGKVCYVGDGVAAVLADQRGQAQARVDAIDVEYEPLAAAVIDLEDALSDGRDPRGPRHQQELHVGAQGRGREAPSTPPSPAAPPTRSRSATSSSG